MVRGNKFKPGEPPKKKRKVEGDGAPGQKAVLRASVTVLAPASVSADRQASKRDKPPQPFTVNRKRHGELDHELKALESRVKRAKHSPTLVLSESLPPGQDQHAKNQKSSSMAKHLDSAPNPLKAASKKTEQHSGSSKQQDQGATKLSKSSLANKRKKARQKAFLQAEHRKSLQATPVEPREDGPASPKRPEKPSLQQGKDVKHPSVDLKTSNDGQGQQIRKQHQAVTKKVQTDTVAPKLGSAGNSNWAQIKRLIGAGTQKDRHLKGNTPTQAEESKRPEPKGRSTEVTPVVAVDCEMVGVGPDGTRSSLARVCIVNEHGNVLMDNFVRQKEKITDYRTKFSGIRPKDVSDESAEPFEDIQRQAAAIMKDRIVVGHAVHNDFRALLLGHPYKLIRDTSKYPPLMRPGGPGRKPKPKALRHLAFEQLGLGIQSGEHSPVEDARATLYLYQLHAKEWEKHLKQGTIGRLTAPLGKKQKIKSMQKGLAELAAKDVMVDL